MSAAFEPFFANRAGHAHPSRFCIWHWPASMPAQQWRGVVVHVHAFAEEMNKSRRMVAQQARAMAAEGYAVLLMDLLGCGDSDADFGQATWQDWQEDVQAACTLAAERWQAHGPGQEPPQRWLWGHRAGSLLAAQAMETLPAGEWQLLLWQPTPNGKTVLQQFLRLEAAAALVGKAGSAGKATAKSLLAAGQAAEVAGYLIHPLLAQGLEAARLPPPTRAQRAVWLDVAAAAAEGGPSPAVRTALDAWQAAGVNVTHHQLQGPSFWQTTEIEDAPQLLSATAAAMQ